MMGSVRARLLLMVGVVIGFTTPLASVRLLTAHRDAQWLKSGLSVYEISEWRDHDFSDVDDAIGWRNARFKAPGALIWREEGWSDAAEASRWRDADFSAREAKRWRQQGFEAWDARPWRDAGFLAEDARRWMDSGAGPTDAASRRKRGEDPR
jgi:hypothetical protein